VKGGEGRVYEECRGLKGSYEGEGSVDLCCGPFVGVGHLWGVTSYHRTMLMKQINS
jgi:hypothetical protein